MRLDRPIGTWLLYWPCAWSVALAGVGGRWDLFLWLALGAFAMRSAGCVYNDIVDRDLDRQVERTRLRPLASGRVSLRSAWLLIAASVPDRAGRAAPAEMGRGADRARQHRAGRRLSVHEAHHLVAAGVARAGLLVGRAGRLAGGDRQPSRWPPLLLWFGSIAWVIGYDTLYAIQDKEDDALVGVKSSARRLGDKAPLGDRHFLRARAAAVGRGDLAGASRLDRARWRSLPPRCTSPARRSAPTRTTASWRCSCSARTGPAALLVFLAMLVVGLSAR